MWTGAKDTGGYGRIYLHGRIEGSNRLSWLIHFGEIPDSLFVCHRCNNKGCVNPNHLYLATNGQNIRDAIKDGIMTFKNHDGEHNGRAILSWADVHTIRNMRSNSNTRISQLAVDFGVSEATISAVLSGRNWKVKGSE